MAHEAQEFLAGDEIEVTTDAYEFELGIEKGDRGVVIAGGYFWIAIKFEGGPLIKGWKVLSGDNDNTPTIKKVS